MSVGTRTLKRTQSICPTCLQVIPARIFCDENGRVRIGKTCPKHGYCEDSYTYSDLDSYRWAELYEHPGVRLQGSSLGEETDYSRDYGLCSQNRSPTVVAVIDVTNRCNLKCPVCFANAGSSGRVYEPTREQIEEILTRLWTNNSSPPLLLQFSGGEPTLRDDLPELIVMARKIGFEHVEVDTNGVRMAADFEFMKRCREAGMSKVYLQFDGVDDDVYRKCRGIPLMPVKKKVIENARLLRQNIVLAVTLIRGVNDRYVGEIIKFAMANSDVVTHVVFQPISIIGRADAQSREAMRINTSELLKLLETQTKGLIKASDFRPLTALIPVFKTLWALKGKRYATPSIAPTCGVVAFLIQMKKGEWIPVTQLADLDRLFKAMGKNGEHRRGEWLLGRIEAITALRHVKINFFKMLWLISKKDIISALKRYMGNVITIVCMHFMDPYNFDFNRVKRCAVHYGLPDGTIRSFCAYNIFHRKEIERKFSIPYNLWLKQSSNNDVSMLEVKQIGNN